MGEKIELPFGIKVIIFFSYLNSTILYNLMFLFLTFFSVNIQQD